MNYMNTSVQSFSKSTGKHFRFRMMGSGPVLMVLGGSNKDWGGTLDLLSSNYTLIIPSISWNVLQKQPSGETVIDYLEKLLAELHINQFSVLAHSISAWIGLSFAKKFSTKINRLILANIPASILDDKNQFDALHRTLSRKSQSAEKADYWYSLVGDHHRELSDSSSAYSIGQIPLLIVSGDQDRFFSNEHIRKLIEKDDLRPNIKIIRYAGHFPMKDNPWYFSAIVKDFLDSIQRLPTKPN